MSSDQGDRIIDHFVTNSRDLTPASLRQVVCVFYVPLSHDPGVAGHCASVLSRTELQRVDRFTCKHEQAHFKQRRAFRRFCGATALGSSRSLSEMVFEETENGRPYLSGLPEFWFSFSSCRSGFLGAWSSTHGIGVDLEDQARNLEAAELAHRFFSESEASVVESAGGPERLRTFYQFWSLKEAALKSIGEGLPFGLDSFEFALGPDPKVIHAPPEHGGAEQFDACLIEGTNYCSAVVIRNLA